MRYLDLLDIDMQLFIYLSEVLDLCDQYLVQKVHLPKLLIVTTFPVEPGIDCTRPIKYLVRR